MIHQAHQPWVAISAKRPGLWRPADAAMPSAKAASPGAKPLSRGRWRSVGERWTCGAMAAAQMGVALLLLAVAATSLLLLGCIRLPNRQVPRALPFLPSPSPLFHPPFPFVSPHPPPLPLPGHPPPMCAPHVDLRQAGWSVELPHEPHEPSANCSSTNPTVVVKTNLWYSDRPFHVPPVFPLCTMDACFNFSRCPSPPAHEPLVYSYWPGTKYFATFNTTRWHTDDPGKACFFFVFLSAGQPRHFKDLPFWGEDGHNHVLISFSDNWSGPPAWSVGKAALMLTAAHLTVHRAAFDVSLPLPPTWKRHAAGLRPLPVGKRRYLVTFMGTRYLGSMHGSFRSSNEFKALHNGRDIIVVTQCGGSTNRRIISEDPSLLPECNADLALFRTFSYPALMNTSFALVPAGRQASTYRFIEALTAGAIPVVVADNWKLPFDDIIPWHRCLLVFPTHLLSRIEPTIRAITPLPSHSSLPTHPYPSFYMQQAAETRRQRYVSIFEEYLASDGIRMRSACQSLTPLVPMNPLIPLTSLIPLI
ncbi:unnamed protein product [Closterium sp. Naga37s-1]|nr:unnamed protein product [Closterium sp. Naga37s-1]